MSISLNPVCKLKRFRSLCDNCGVTATIHGTLNRDGEYVSILHYCDACYSLKPWLKFGTGYRSGGKHLHNYYGRANSDIQSLTQSSIRRWGEKIKVREVQ